MGTQSAHLGCTECRPEHLNCKICGVCEELHVQSSHTKPKPNELVGEVCLCDGRSEKDLKEAETCL